MTETTQVTDEPGSLTPAQKAARTRAARRREQGEPTLESDGDRTRGRKVTVYLAAAEADMLDRSGLKISDIVKRGFAVTPMSPDGTVPPELREAMSMLAHAAGLLANGGHVFTALATRETIEHVLGLYEPSELRTDDDPDAP